MRLGGMQDRRTAWSAMADIKCAHAEGRVAAADAMWGTPLYISPEVLDRHNCNKLRRRLCAAPIVSWLVGVLTFEILTLCPFPFRALGDLPKSTDAILEAMSVKYNALVRLSRICACRSSDCSADGISCRLACNAFSMQCS